MDYLANFPDTQSVMRAEQIFMRKKIPFETVPRIKYDRKKCGLGILFAVEFLNDAETALAKARIQVDFQTMENQYTPKK